MYLRKYNPIVDIGVGMVYNDVIKLRKAQQRLWVVEIMMMSRRELESILGTKITDEQWEENLKIFNKMSEEEWENEHPLDD